jgi:hypothetical protein
MTAIANEAMYPYIFGAYGSTIPGNTRGVLLVRDEFVGGTQHIDFAQMDAFFEERHPELFVTAGDKRVLDMTAIPPTALKAFLATQRPNIELKALEVGHLVTPGHSYLDYATVINHSKWQTGVGVMGNDGKFTVLPVHGNTRPQN